MACNLIVQIRQIAERIVVDIQPQTVLIVGGGVEFLVELLRQREISAFGLNISENAIPNERPDIQPYCWVGSITDPLPQQYDLIVWMELSEYLSSHETQQAIENLCQHSSDVLLVATSSDYPETSLGYWGELFARHNFFRDVNFDAPIVTLWAARFQKTSEPIGRVIAAYERRLGQLEQENRTYRELSAEQREKLATQEQKVLAWETRWARLEGSMSWVVAQKLQEWRSRLAPPASIREQALEDLLQAVRTRQLTALVRALSHIEREIIRQARVILWGMWLRVKPPPASQIIQVDEVSERFPLQPHQSIVDVIICVHNALSDLQRCLESVERHTTPPYSLILVDDGSDLETQTFLSEFANAQGTALLRNEEAQGYTRAANQGLRHSSADYVILLNSDTVVTAGWLDRLIACVESNPQIGLVGPLSNTASWQSIPEVGTDGNWAANPLPLGVTIDEMGQLVARYSARSYPLLPFLNGFCLLIRRQVLDEIGYFDEENFGPGYGEEDDYAIRACQAGWLLALADDAYVYHSQSRSYSNERRKQLSERAGFMLAKKHGSRVISQGIARCRQDRVLAGIRVRSRVMFDRREWIAKGRARFRGRRLLFVLPIVGPGGGGNVVINEAMAMRAMGVDVRIFNLIGHRGGFERNYPALELPVLYGEKRELIAWASQYDSVIATANFAVEWLVPLTRQDGRPVLGYYVQEFEPYMYPPGTEDFQRACASYSLLPDLVCFTKTDWTRQEVKKQTGVECSRVGVSLNIDLLRPRPRSGSGWPERPLRIVAMVRPCPPYRNAKLTMELLRRTSRQYGARVEIVIFGVSLDDPGFADLPRDFAWNLAGVLTQKQVAQLMNEVDIFVDFSSHQAMGLTALEAMACGAAVIVPARGGAVSFARHEENSLVVDTSSPEVCWQAVQRLIEDDNLRAHLQRNALVDVGEFFPERPAFNILRSLFDPEDSNN